ncbi:8128_t:CDS:2 [Cetraspora pellucida]|uniref:8128_t:CDS:1 n=1 Tax=Cetraspora pellucida TaxID=1433469 RepID=A0A9N8WL32_9GLOM|nr:8128_t:CDS:2 [Cetraspora pellucida]
MVKSASMDNAVIKCADGQTCCNKNCIDTNSDSKNCGSCGKACAAGETCQDGTCVNPGCSNDSQCSDGVLYNLTYPDYPMPATGNCINSTCYLCLFCTFETLCNSIQNAACVNTTNCSVHNTCNCCAPAPQTTSLAE